MKQVGIVGLGFMGMIHYLSYLKQPGVRVAAICTRNPKRLAGDWTDIQGNFGPPGQQMDLSGIHTTNRFEDLLENPAIDLVDITLPPAAHPAAVISALHAGKDVFCEKPLALTLPQCQEMSATAQTTGRLLMVGHVLPFFPEYAWARELVASGKYGKLRGGTFRRVISDPLWLEHYWNAEQVGGPLFDLHVHDAHFIRLLFGMPHDVVSRGRMRNRLPEFWHTSFDYGPDGPVVTAASGTIPQQGRPFTHGFEIYLDEATLQFEFAVHGREGRTICPPTLFDSNGGVNQIALSGGDPMDVFETEIAEVLRCIRQRETSPILSGELAQDAISICAMQAKNMSSYRSLS